MDQIPGQYHDGIITVAAQNSSFIGEVSFHIDYEKNIVEYNRAIITAIFECPLILQNYVITLRVFNEERTVNIYQPGSKEVNEPRKYVASWVAYNGGYAEEHVMIASALPSLNGSSPRMRRSIFHPPEFVLTGMVYPRVCGEYRNQPHILAILSGSSPHTRGIRNKSIKLLFCHGIIPAHAGSTGRNTCTCT